MAKEDKRFAEDERDDPSINDTCAGYVAGAYDIYERTV
jgi:hypothetical protein